MNQILDKTKQTESQMAKIWKHLKKGRSITNWEAISKYRVTYLSHYIYELKKQGHKINKTWHKNQNGNRYAIYKLEK